MSLPMMTSEYKHMLRILNMNVDGKKKVWLGLTQIKGVGRRMSVLILKKAGIDINTRAGFLTEEEINKLTTILANPLQFQIPKWFLNRQRDIKDGQFKHLCTNHLDSALRDDLERLKKMRCHRGIRHTLGLKVRGQRTKATGRGRKHMVARKK